MNNYLIHYEDSNWGELKRLVVSDKPLSVKEIAEKIGGTIFLKKIELLVCVDT